MAMAVTTPILPDSQSLANFLLVLIRTRIPTATFCFNLHTNVGLLLLFLFYFLYKKSIIDAPSWCYSSCLSLTQDLVCTLQHNREKYFFAICIYKEKPAVIYMFLSNICGFSAFSLIFRRVPPKQTNKKKATLS